MVLTRVMVSKIFSPNPNYDNILGEPRLVIPARSIAQHTAINIVRRIKKGVRTPFGKVTKVHTTAYAHFVHFSRRSPHDLQPKTAILRQKPLRHSHFLFVPSAQWKLFFEKSAICYRIALLRKELSATSN
jgi:hypothetical protein